MLSEKIIFNMPPFTYSDTENYGVPYIVMPHFGWNNDWNEYCRQSERHRSPAYLPPPLPHGENNQRFYHNRPWILNDEDSYANGAVRFQLPRKQHWWDITESMHKPKTRVTGNVNFALQTWNNVRLSGPIQSHHLKDTMKANGTCGACIKTTTESLPLQDCLGDSIFKVGVHDFVWGTQISLECQKTEFHNQVFAKEAIILPRDTTVTRLKNSFLAIWKKETISSGEVEREHLQ